MIILHLRNSHIKMRQLVEVIPGIKATEQIKQFIGFILSCCDHQNCLYPGAYFGDHSKNSAYFVSYCRSTKPAYWANQNPRVEELDNPVTINSCFPNFGAFHAGRVSPS